MRRALIDADVSYQTAKKFVQEVKEKADFPNDKIMTLRYELIKEELSEWWISNLVLGAAVPIPTFPPLIIRILSVPSVVNLIYPLDN